MAVDRVKFQDIVASQIPDFVRDDFPLLVEFLEQYYVSQEFQSGTYDIIQNIDQYVNVDELYSLKNSTVLGSNISYFDTSISTSEIGNFTYGFPDRDGLLKIDNEIIYYKYKTETSFEECVRGFSAVTSYTNSNIPDELVFSTSEIDEHTNGTTIYNLNVLFLQEFFKKLKNQVSPGFSERDLYSGLDQRNFIYNVDSFYSSKGTDQSFEILFRALYGEDVEVIKPSEKLIRPSNAYYKVTRDFVIQGIQGNPLDLKNRTLYQDSSRARGTVTDVKPIYYEDNQYYQISIDYGYQRDIDVSGTVFSEFSPNKNTKLLNSVSIGSTVIDVDSTIGFPEVGNLTLLDIDNNTINLTYSGKNDNQFFNVSGLVSTIDEGTTIRENDFSYAYVGADQSEQIKVRITSTLKDLKLIDSPYFYRKDDTIKVKTLGSNLESERIKNWNLNIKTYWKIERIELDDIQENKYKIITYDKIFFKPGYIVKLKNINSGVSISATVVSENSSRTFIIKASSPITDLNQEYQIENQILKTNSSKYPYLNNYISNVQNTYSKYNGDVLVSTNSLSSYSDFQLNPYDKSVSFSGTVFGEVINLTTSSDHGFLTGDAVYYSPSIIKITTITPDGNTLVTETESKFPEIDEGVYYIKRISENSVKLSRSRSDLFANDFITLSGTVSNNTFTHLDFYGRNLEPQGIYRLISDPTNKSGSYTTKSGYTGILINGVEILNYKSTDKINYGNIEEFNVLNSGKDYDVINPPELRISDSTGVGATGFVAVSGDLKRIDILDTGFDYQDKPVVNITGGNGNGAKAEVRLSSVVHSVPFYSESSSNYVDLTNDTIGFATYHKFRDNEKVVYETNSLKSVGGLSTNSFYYVGVLDSNTIKLYNTENDSISGINTVNLTSYGSGVHNIRASTLKNIVTGIVVTDPGFGYQNKKREIVGINTNLNEFTIKNHGYKSKEIVQYRTSGQSIEGLSTTKDYYIVKVNEDIFSLSEVGSGSTSVDYYYNNNIIVDVKSEGDGSFNYRPITVSVDGVTGVSTRTGQDFSCKVTPVFRGTIDSIGISSGGSGYGSPEIVNFDRQPLITLFSGSSALLIPVISNGRIVDVLINSQGNGYNSPPDIEIISDTGRNASLTPVIRNGKIVDVKIIKGGAGYVANKTSILVHASGTEASIDCKIKEWNINVFERDFNNILNEDGFVRKNISDTSLEYSHVYAPRLLRKYTYAISGTNEDNTLYGIPDLVENNGIEVDSKYHSPIIGWAYDGNPIYGPFGFENNNGLGSVRRMRSSYELRSNIDNNRPPTSIYPLGFFVEDYIYTGSGDLDIHNGRFCVTPDYPEGVYAYFSTINSIVDSSGPFKNYKRPVFPYFIGNSFKSVPIDYNFRFTSNQNEYDIQSENWLRNTKSYGLNSSNSGYSYIFNSNQEQEQTIDITSSSIGYIEGVDIVFGGSNYKVNDTVIFDESGTGGTNANAKVSIIDGKEINTVSLASSILYDVEFIPSSNQNGFIAFSTVPHNLENNNLVSISGISEYFSGFDGKYNIRIRPDSFVLNSGIGSTAITGITTYFYISGLLNYPYLRENDILVVDQERVKVLNIDAKSSRIRVLRAQDGTVGTSHTNSTALIEDPRKFNINVGLSKTTKIFNYNKELYFDPAESLGIGTILGTGVGNTVSFSNPGIGVTQIFIRPQSIYYPNHGFKINDPITYTTNGGSSIQTWDGVGPYKNLSTYSELYAVPLTKDTFAIGGNKIGLGTTGSYVGVNTNTGLLYFTNTGSGVVHSFKTNLQNVISGEVSKNLVTVSTSSTHGLSLGDTVDISVKPNTTITVSVKYDDYNGRIVFDPRSFNAGDVNTTQNTISFADNYFKTGDKVIHTSTSPSGGLINEGIYYIISFNSNKVRLVRNKIDLISQNPNFVDITSASGGTLSKINPPLNVSRNTNLKFDLSDSSLSFISNGVRYSAFDMNIFTDREYSNIFFTSGKAGSFEVIKQGKPGVDSNANLTIRMSDYVPNNLYYKFDIDNINFIPNIKSNISQDTSVSGYNEISIINSPYSGKYSVSGIGTTTFTYDIETRPDTLLYNSTNSTLSYSTNSRTASGPIKKIDVVSGGLGYRDLPGITSVRSDRGSNAILEISSKNIGKILENRINNIGFDYPTDTTVRASANLPELLKIDALSSFERIGITSSGKNYLVAPTLVIIDGYTNEVIDDIDLTYKLGDSEVTILKNTFGINEAKPIIIPTQNSNGIGIASVTYDSSTKVVRVYLDSQFSDASDFRFNNGSRVLIENLSVGVGSTGRGYNSQNYNYTLFEVTNSDSQLGGSGSWFEYSLNNLLANGEIPGKIDFDNSSGRAIPESDFPIFESVLKKNNFFIGETIKSDSNIGVVERWNPKTSYLVISTSDDFSVGSRVIGRSSNTQGTIKNKIDFNAEINTGVGATFYNDWQSNSGFLNDSLQRIPNNEYYQNLSYSLKSKIPYEIWNDAVSSLNHTSGFAKFADLVIESIEDDSEGVVKFTDSSVDLIVDIIGEASLHCVYDFDYVGERTIDVDGKIISNEITFENRILTDYFESVGNRALSIDDFSNQFNSVARPTNFSPIATYGSNYTYNKIFTFARDQVYTNKKQSAIVTVLQNDSIAYIQEYAKVESDNDLGSFDYAVTSGGWDLLFYPVDFAYNSYDTATVSFSVLNDIVGTGTTSLGNIINIFSSQEQVAAGTTTTIVSIANTYRSSKLLVQLEDTNNEYSVSELNIVHDGTNAYILEYGDMQTSSGFGTFNAYISGSDILVDFIPSVGVAITANTSIVSIANTNSIGISTVNLDVCSLTSTYTSIAASTSPTANVISSFTNPIEANYYIISVEDLTNGKYEMFETVVVKSSVGPSFFVEYANVQTHESLGQVGIDTVGSSLQLTYTPNANIETQVRTIGLGLQIFDDNQRASEIDLENVIINTDNRVYTGSLLDLKTAFPLRHNGLQIFQRPFDGSNSQIVNIDDNSITIPDHYFVTGERIVYTSPGTGTTAAVGIATTTISGIGLTDKLPQNLYVVKIDNKKIKFATTAENALRRIPTVLDINSTGIGVGHSITSTNQNSKVLLAVDNMIQSPIVSSGVTSLLSNSIIFDTEFSLSGISSIFANDYIKIDDEIMIVTGIGAGGANTIDVRRAQMGTLLEAHSGGALVTKLSGNYNIVQNTLHFASAPKGRVPVGIATGAPDERDWTGITTGSSFQGRSFIRSGYENTSLETYAKNYIYDDVSNKFTGIRSEFSLTVNSGNVTGIATQRPILLINGIYQEPNGVQPPSIQQGDYTLSESSGITSITFTGNNALPTGWDPNNGEYPLGGLIISVGSTEGFGYQPLVSAGGTAVVSIAGTIESISIGNSGSGYRSGIQTVVNVGVQTYSSGVPNIEFIGTATISGGNIVSVAITNPGIGYTASNPPQVVFDAPLRYSNIPVQYSSSSVVGSGQSATVDIIVGQGSSVISFEFKNYGFGYGVNEILTIPVGGSTGIPTNTNLPFKEFQISIDRVFSDSFGAWSIGELEVLDNLDDEFDGVKTNFRLSINGDTFSAKARKGSPIDIEKTLIVFINDILQEPGKAFSFAGGSIIKFSEAPKPGDTSKILFYKGTSGLDVAFVDILETIKVGDTLDIDNNPEFDQGIRYDQDERVVVGINTIDSVETNPYIGPGITTDPNLLRPVTWCKQTSDKIINGQVIGKDRIHYEPLIYPGSYIIQPVSAGSTFAYIDNLRPIFNSTNESPVTGFQNIIKIVSQDTLVGSIATATVSVAGTISSINITNPGYGYTQAPQVTISTPVGIETSQRATATAFIGYGTVHTISVSSPGTGYTSSNPPSVLIEPPTLFQERIDVTSYTGDYGILVGFGRSTIGSQTQLILDFFIPEDSFMRDNGYVGSAVTVSGISTGDYFTLFNTNVAIAATETIISQRIDKSQIAITTSFVDSVFQVQDAYTLQTNVIGVGTTSVRRVFTNVAGISTLAFDNSLVSFDSNIYTFDTRSFTVYAGGISSSFNFGSFSWGKVIFDSRVGIHTFNFYGNDGYSGITTSALITRSSPLKYDNYIT